MRIAALFALTLAVFADSTSDETFGPYLQSPTATSIVVCWVTKTAAPSTVEYGTTPSYGSVVSIPTPVKEHQVTLAGLTPGTLYYYKVAGGLTATGSFRTLVTGAPMFRFVHMGETHVDTAVTGFAEEINAAEPLLILDSSDQVDHGLVRKEWDRYFTYGQAFYSKTPLLAAVGNHTYTLSSGIPIPGSWGKSEFRKIMANPGNEEWYSVRCGNTLFICLNSTWYFESPKRIFKQQREWLKATLQAATDGVDDPTFKVVYMHIPMFSSGPKYREYLERKVLRFFFQPLFEQYGVDLVLSGHDKMNEHSKKNGVHYAQSACGEIGNPFQTSNPASLWKDNVTRAVLIGTVFPDKIVCDFVAADGTVLYSFLVD